MFKEYHIFIVGDKKYNPKIGIELDFILFCIPTATVIV